MPSATHPRPAGASRSRWWRRFAPPAVSKEPHGADHHDRRPRRARPLTPARAYASPAAGCHGQRRGPMRYTLFGRSGLRVSELCLGTMTFGEDWGWGASQDESRRIFERFVEAGGNFIDTSNNYTNGTSERFVGEFTREERERFVLASKYSLSTRPDDPNAGGNHRKNMVQALEASLKRLGTDYLDLYWLHMWDAMTPVEEVMRAFDDLVRA